MALCGPSAQQESIASQQQGLAQTMNQDFQSRFKDQDALLANLNASLTPIVARGPSQMGFSPEELAAKNTRALNTAAAANRNARQAAGNLFAGQNNTSGLQSGIRQAIEGGISSSAAEQLANEQNRITEESYDVGRKQYNAAVVGSEALAGQYKPESFGSQAESGFNTAFGEEKEINSEKQALGKAVLSGSMALAGSLAGGFGNLDTMGTSTKGEQVGNFFSGMA